MGIPVNLHPPPWVLVPLCFLSVKLWTCVNLNECACVNVRFACPHVWSRAEWHSLWFRPSVSLDQTRSVSLSKIISCCACAVRCLCHWERRRWFRCRRRVAGEGGLNQCQSKPYIFETRTKQLDFGQWRTCKMVSADKPVIVWGHYVPCLFASPAPV